jgi:DNA-directed RNA polymerase specialized sigma24 family protein
LACLAEDITQDVLVRAQARWGRIGRLDAPEQYVKRMVVNEFLSWRRRKAAQVVLVPSHAPAPLVRDDVVRIAESVVLDPSPDLTWLGR